MFQKSTILFALLFLINLTSAKAQKYFQPGFVILNTGDTIHGEIDIKSEAKMKEACSFRLSEESKTTTYSPREIQAFRLLDGTFFVSRKIDEKRHYFLEYLVDGILDVYYYTDGGRSEHYFLEKEGMPLREILFEKKIVQKNGKVYQQASTRHYGLIKSYVADNPQIAKEVESIQRPTHKNLIQLAKN